MMEWKVMQWIDDVIEEPRNRFREYPDCIKDGAALCKLMSVLAPGCINDIEGSNSNSAATRVENFRQAVRQYGVPEADIFNSKDLLEKQNVPAVTHCLQVLAQMVEQRGFDGPKLNTSVPNDWERLLDNHAARQIFH